MQTSLLVLGCNRIHKGAFSAGHHIRTVPVFASLVVNPRRRIQCFASLVVNPRRSIAPAAQLRRRHRGTCQFSLRDLVVQHAGHHPCWKAAHFLPCTRPPDVLRLPRAQRGRIHYGPSHRRAFVAMGSGFQRMTGGHGAVEDDTAPAVVTDAAAGPGRRYGAAAGPGRRFTAVTAQDAHGPTTATGDPKDSPTATILTPQLFRSTTSALTKSFLTTTSISSVTPKPDLPSCPLLASSSLNLPPMPMSQTKSFCFYVLLLGANSHFRSEGSLSGGLLFRLCSFSLRLCLEG